MMNEERGQGLISKYVWRIETIYRAKRISFEELSRRWLRDDIGGGLKIEETERTDYSIFTCRLRPAFDFVQEILRNGADIEALQLAWLRKETAETAKRMWSHYKEDKR